MTDVEKSTMVPFKRTKHAFGDYISSVEIKKLLEGSEDRGLTVKHFQYVILLADDTEAQSVLATIKEVTATLVQHHATTSILSGLVIGWLGAPSTEGNSREARLELVEALQRVGGKKIKVVHGECDAPVGVYGGKERRTYGALISGFADVLQRLLDTNLGESSEFR